MTNIETSKKEYLQPLYSKSLLKKRLSRLGAVQCLYALACQESHDINTALDDVLGIYKAEPQDHNTNDVLLVKLARGADQHREVLIAKLEPLLAKNWRFARLAIVVQCLLLTAAYEICFLQDAERAVLINEYIEIAKMMNHSGEATFINSVLDKIL